MGKHDYVAQRSFGGDGTGMYRDCSSGYINLYLCLKTESCTKKRREGGRNDLSLE